MEGPEIRSVLCKLAQLLKENIEYYDAKAEQSQDLMQKQGLIIMTNEMKKVTEEIGEMYGNLEI